MKALRDTVTLFGRSIRHIQRSPDTIITVAIMPIAFMLLFGYVFGGAIHAGTGNHVNSLRRVRPHGHDARPGPRIRGQPAGHRHRRDAAFPPRSLLYDQPVGTDIWTALAWCTGNAIIAYFFAMRVYRRVP